MRTYVELSDDHLEELLRERAFKEDAELSVTHRPDDEDYPWIAEYKLFNVELAPQGVSRLSAEAPTKREALVGLAQAGDLEEQERAQRERD